MSKKTLRIITIISTIVAVLCIGSMSLATDPKSLTGTKTEAFNPIGNTIIGVLQAIGTILSVAILIALGIKYMMGSAEEKAEYKKTMIPYLIGAILIFVAPQIAGAIYSFASKQTF